jgi:putative FmdB family regulatory protein
MPTYSYRCPNCGHEYDKFQKISDTSSVACPECGTPGERQISGGAGILFKGSGFYITDYKRAGEKKEEKPKSDSKPTPGSTDKKSQSKSDSGADS